MHLPELRALLAVANLSDESRATTNLDTAFSALLGAAVNVGATSLVTTQSRRALTRGLQLSGLEISEANTSTQRELPPRHKVPDKLARSAAESALGSIELKPLVTNPKEILDAIACQDGSIEITALGAFLCAVCPSPWNRRIELVKWILDRCGTGYIEKEAFLLAVPAGVRACRALHGILVKDSEPTGFASFSSTVSLLRGLSSTAYDAISTGDLGLGTPQLESFLGMLSNHISGWIVEQNVLEHSLMLMEDDQGSDTLKKQSELLAKSKRLLARFVEDEKDLEAVMLDVWRGWWAPPSTAGDDATGLNEIHPLKELPHPDAEPMSRKRVDLTVIVPGSVEEPVAKNDDGDAHTLDISKRGIGGGTLSDGMEWEMYANGTSGRVPKSVLAAEEAADRAAASLHHALLVDRASDEENAKTDAIGAVQRLVQSVGMKIVLLGSARFLLLLSVICADGAFALFLTVRIGYSVEFSLAMVVVMNVGIATLALFCAVRGNGQISEDTSKVVGGLGGGGKEDGMQETVPNMLQPVVKSVVGSLVPMRSNNSMIPVRTLPLLSHCSELDASTPRTLLRKELSRANLGQMEKPVARKSLASKFKGIVKAVGKIAAHLDDDKSDGGGIMERGPGSKLNPNKSHQHAGSACNRRIHLPPNDTEIISSMYADAYPDLVDDL